MELVVGRHCSAATWLDAGDGLPSLSLGQLQRTDDDVPAGTGFHHPSPSRQAWTAWKRSNLNMTGCVTSDRLRRCSSTNIRRRGLISAASVTNMQTIFEIPMIATEVHRRFCLELAKQIPSYSDDLWGITASDSPKGYVIWGGPPAVGPIDGTIVPSASAGSLAISSADRSCGSCERSKIDILGMDQVRVCECVQSPHKMV